LTRGAGDPDVVAPLARRRPSGATGHMHPQWSRIL
jgi:hypothetical protein